MTAPLLETRDVCRHFRMGTPREVRAVDGVSLQIARGSMTAFAGASGSGKTTLLSLLGLLDRPTSGVVLVDGRDHAQSSEFERTRCRRRMGFVFQDFALLPRLTAFENIAYALLPRGGERAERAQLAQEWLDRVGLTEQRDSRSSELSGGEQQRVALARAFAVKPEIVLMDEPTSNLDRQSSDNVRQLLLQACQEETTLIVASHDEQLLELATTVHRLEGGELVH